MTEGNWIVAQGADYEGCYEHFGPFDTEKEANHFAKVQKQKEPVYEWWAFQLTTPDELKAKQAAERKRLQQGR